MRFIMKISIPVDTGNEAIKDGSLPKKIQSILADQKPEAAYFTVNERGERTAFIVLDLAEPSRMVAVAEPWFLAFDAGVEYFPAMTPEDLGKAAPYMADAVKKYAS
jgi:hypothetical protein